jgi:arylformamidase
MLWVLPRADAISSEGRRRAGTRGRVAGEPAISPAFWIVPTGRTLDVVVGGLESNEFLRHGSGIADAWAKQDAKTRYEAVVNTNHFTVFDRLGDLHGAMAKRLLELIP